MIISVRKIARTIKCATTFAIIATVVFNLAKSTYKVCAEEKIFKSELVQISSPDSKDEAVEWFRLQEHERMGPLIGTVAPTFPIGPSPMSGKGKRKSKGKGKSKSKGKFKSLTSYCPSELYSLDRLQWDWRLSQDEIAYFKIYLFIHLYHPMRQVTYLAYTKTTT